MFECVVLKAVMVAALGLHSGAHRPCMPGLLSARTVVLTISAMSRAQDGLRCNPASNQADSVTVDLFHMRSALTHSAIIMRVLFATLILALGWRYERTRVCRACFYHSLGMDYALAPLEGINMTNYETYEYVLPTYALSALINGDVSGLEDNEVETIEQFERRVIKRHGVGHWAQQDNAGYESYFAHYNDIDGTLGNDCEDWQYVVFNK